MKRFYSLLLAIGLLMALSLTASGASRHSVTILIDGVPLDASSAYVTDGTTMVPLRAVAEALGCEVVWDADTYTVQITSAAAPPEEAAPEYDALVVIDPGHGGTSDGAEYGGVKEKDLNLAIAAQAAAYLEEAGVAVKMTRKYDIDVDLYERTELANELGADLFVSVHCNASDTHDDVLGIYTCSHSEGTDG